MKTTQVAEIIHAFKEGTPLHPSVRLGDRITYAVELMLDNDLTCIAVKRCNHPLGIINLHEALEKLGIRIL